MPTERRWLRKSEKKVKTRNHWRSCRYVSWQAAMLRPNNKVSQYDAVPFSSPHYSNYYVQEEADDGVVMESTVPAKDVLINSLFFLLFIPISWSGSFFSRIHFSLSVVLPIPDRRKCCYVCPFTSSKLKKSKRKIEARKKKVAFRFRDFLCTKIVPPSCCSMINSVVSLRGTGTRNSGAPLLF